MMMKNSQHDPIKNPKIDTALKSTAKLPVNCANKATRYPNGVRQFHGSLH